MSAKHTTDLEWRQRLDRHLSERKAAYSTSLRKPLQHAREMRDAMAAVDATYDREYAEDGRAFRQGCREQLK